MICQPAQLPTVWSDMALIVITVIDSPGGNTDVSVQCEPAMDSKNPNTLLTGAQVVAMNMLNAMKAEPLVKDRGLIALIN